MTILSTIMPPVLVPATFRKRNRKTLRDATRRLRRSNRKIQRELQGGCVFEDLSRGKPLGVLITDWEHKKDLWSMKVLRAGDIIGSAIVKRVDGDFAYAIAAKGQSLQEYSIRKLKDAQKEAYNELMKMLGYARRI